jgi:hypothetical protein
VKNIDITIGYETVNTVDDVFADVFETEEGQSLFGSEHITVGEMVRRVQMHGKLLEALAEFADGRPCEPMEGRRYCATHNKSEPCPIGGANAAIAKAKGTK